VYPRAITRGYNCKCVERGKVVATCTIAIGPMPGIQGANESTPAQGHMEGTHMTRVLDRGGCTLIIFKIGFYTVI